MSLVIGFIVAFLVSLVLGKVLIPLLRALQAE